MIYRVYFIIGYYEVMHTPPKFAHPAGKFMHPFSKFKRFQWHLRRMLRDFPQHLCLFMADFPNQISV